MKKIILAISLIFLTTMAFSEIRKTMDQYQKNGREAITTVYAIEGREPMNFDTRYQSSAFNYVRLEKDFTFLDLAMYLFDKNNVILEFRENEEAIRIIIKMNSTVIQEKKYLENEKEEALIQWTKCNYAMKKALESYIY